LEEGQRGRQLDPGRAGPGDKEDARLDVSRGGASVHRVVLPQRLAQRERRVTADNRLFVSRATRPQGAVGRRKWRTAIRGQARGGGEQSQHEDDCRGERAVQGNGSESDWGLCHPQSPSNNNHTFILRDHSRADKKARHGAVATKCTWWVAMAVRVTQEDQEMMGGDCALPSTPILALTFTIRSTGRAPHRRTGDT
jgi:hypothetical protein